MKNYFILLSFIALLYFPACKQKSETLSPSTESITESVYASGIIKSLNQYQAYATVNGIIQEIYVKEGQEVKKGTPILRISNDIQRLNKENSQLAAAFSDYESNTGKIRDAEMIVEVSKNKMLLDSSLLSRQKILFSQDIGSKIELEQRELAYQNAKATYLSAKVKLDDLKKQLAFSSTQAKKNLAISKAMEGDYILKSEIDGTVYDLKKSLGEIVTIQAPLAIIGDSKNYYLELQVDEKDIFKVKKGQKAVASIGSYKNQTFHAKISEIYPIMDERKQSFTVNAIFENAPPLLYPNITLEANIIIETKNNALLIPRNYTINDKLVIKENGDTISVTTGLKDYKKIEIISGITADDKLIKPVQ
jgi:HlyD family secretion protein